MLENFRIQDTGPVATEDTVPVPIEVTLEDDLPPAIQEKVQEKIDAKILAIDDVFEPGSEAPTTPAENDGEDNDKAVASAAASRDQPVLIEVTSTAPPPKADDGAGGADPPRDDPPTAEMGEGDDDETAKDEITPPTDTLPTESSPEQEELSRRVLVEEAHIGETELAVVLCTHTADFGAQIAEELQDCDVIAVEAGGYPDEEAQQEDAKLLEVLLSENIERQRAEAFCNGVLGDTIFSTMLPPLFGSDKKIVHIDITRDHPANQLQIESDETYADYRQTVQQLAPLEEMQDRNHRRLAADHTVRVARDTHMAQQLRQLNENLRPEEDSVKIGVVTGMAHYGIISSLEENTEGKSEQIAQRVKPNLLTEIQASIAVGEGDPQAEELANRALLGDLCALTLTNNDDPTTWQEHRAIEKRVQGLNSTDLELILDQLRDDLARTDEPNTPETTKIQRLKARLKPIIDDTEH